MLIEKCINNFIDVVTYTNQSQLLLNYMGALNDELCILKDLNQNL